jgi:hypothetical protein
MVAPCPPRGKETRRPREIRSVMESPGGSLHRGLLVLAFLFLHRLVAELPILDESTHLAQTEHFGGGQMMLGRERRPAVVAPQDAVALRSAIDAMALARFLDLQACARIQLLAGPTAMPPVETTSSGTSRESSFGVGASSPALGGVSARRELRGRIAPGVHGPAGTFNRHVAPPRGWVQLGDATMVRRRRILHFVTVNARPFA